MGFGSEKPASAISDFLRNNGGYAVIDGGLLLNLKDMVLILMTHFGVPSVSFDSPHLVKMIKMKFRSVVTVCRSLRQFSSSGKFDFTDLTSPHTWYPVARRKKHNVVLHVGPINSGKTYHALKQLVSSSSGLYCGPLRFLAWEVAKKLNKAKVPCGLITGQEREEVEGAKHKSVTVEMADLNSDYQCAVVDEIQATIQGFESKCFSKEESEALLQKSVEIAREARDIYYENNGNERSLGRTWIKSTGVSDVDFISYVNKWHEAGASLIGGCCRTAPNTIRAISNNLSKGPDAPRPSEPLTSSHPVKCQLVK